MNDPQQRLNLPQLFLQIMQLEKLLKALTQEIFCVKVKLFGNNLLIFQILLSQTVVRILSRQPLFYIIRYSFPIYLTFPRNRKTPETLRFRGILRLDTRYLSTPNLYYYL